MQGLLLVVLTSLAPVHGVPALVLLLAMSGDMSAQQQAAKGKAAGEQLCGSLKDIQ